MRTDPIAQASYPCAITVTATPQPIRSLLPAAILEAIGDRRVGQLELSPAGGAIEVRYQAGTAGISVAAATTRVIAGTDCDNLLVVSKSGSNVTAEVLLYTTNTVTSARG